MNDFDKRSKSAGREMTDDEITDTQRKLGFCVHCPARRGELQTRTVHEPFGPIGGAGMVLVTLLVCPTCGLVYWPGGTEEPQK